MLSQLSAVLLVVDVRYPGILQFPPGFVNTENDAAKETEETKRKDIISNVYFMLNLYLKLSSSLI
jgi:hypothetical protein